jgi:hypothetical protein
MKEFQKYFDMFSSMTGQSHQTDKDRAAATAAEKPEILCYAPTVFKLPIDYLEQNEIHPLNTIVSTDLELVEGEAPMYKELMSPRNVFSEQIIPLYGKHFTSNSQFLQDTQETIENMASFESYQLQKDKSYCSTEAPYTVPCDVIQKLWKDVKHTKGFKDRYGYLDWSFLEHLNESSMALQGITISNMLSPLMSFFVPFIFLLVPFFILKMQGIPITLTVYIDVLKNIARHHFIGKAISTFQSFTLKNFVYLIVMLGLYGLQMYQNTMQCLRFYRNIQKINDDLLEWKQYIDYSLEQTDAFLHTNSSLKSYVPFCHELNEHKRVLLDLQSKLHPLYPFQCSIWKSTDIGYMMKVYYEIHSSNQYENTLLYTMGFHGYLDNLYGIHEKMNTGVINKAMYCTTDEPVETYDASNNLVPECTIEQQYYPLHKEDGVKNDAILDDFGVITGPNASGKTTYLKTTAINVILSQQFGVGFYQSCTLRPYHFIHSYLNIPDTSGRDSLFQAESRRCKEILDNISNNNNRQFCIFDELYSGTNPTEATRSAYAFLEYLRKYKHVDLYLTTHYVSICDKWTTDNESKRAITNYQMIVTPEYDVLNDDNSTSDKRDNDDEDDDEDDDDKKTEQVKKWIPTYKIGKGISRIEGALGILEDMEYPEEIIDIIRTQQ